MSVLPNVSEVKAIEYHYFPTRWQAVIWRNWGYIQAERIAAVLDTSCENIREAAKQIGLNPDEPVNEQWEKRGFLTTIRDNWHLCTYEQILTLLNISDESLIEETIKDSKPESSFQFMRNGYFCVDKDSTPENMIFNRTVQLNSSWGK